MQRSIFLAKLIGPLLVAIGIALIFNADIFRTMAAEFFKSYALIYIAGLLALTAGLAIVNTHNEWTGDWRVVITILGWLCVIGGIVRIVFPNVVETLGASMIAAVSNGWIIGEGVVFVAFGAWLSFMGYAPGNARAKRKR
jgi:uncharacterized membrane protein